MGGAEKKGRETRFYKGGQAGPRDGCLKKGGAATPLQTMD